MATSLEKKMYSFVCRPTYVCFDTLFRFMFFFSFNFRPHLLPLMLHYHLPLQSLPNLPHNHPRHNKQMNQLLPMLGSHLASLAVSSIPQWYVKYQLTNLQSPLMIHLDHCSSPILLAVKFNLVYKNIILFSMYYIRLLL
jgi:hypothetical protein